MGSNASGEKRRSVSSDGDQAVARMVAVFRDQQTLFALDGESSEVRKMVAQAGFSTARSPLAIAGGVQVDFDRVYRKRFLHSLRAARLKDEARIIADSAGFYLSNYIGAASGQLLRQLHC